MEGSKITSFFITEFGENWRARDLLFELKECGDIVEIVIPQRRDRRRRRYGFERFANEGDTDLLAIKLDSIMLEGRKLYVNLPRFQRLINVMTNVNNGGGLGHTKQGVPNGSAIQIKARNEWIDARSFADVIGNKKAKNL